MKKCAIITDKYAANFLKSFIKSENGDVFNLRPLTENEKTMYEEFDDSSLLIQFTMSRQSIRNLDRFLINLYY